MGVYTQIKDKMQYFAYFGLIYLLILTIRDYSNKMIVDDRHNFFMTGIAVSLMTHYTRGFFYLLGLAAITVILNILLKKKRALGEADINSLSWIFLGFGIISPYVLGYFAAILIILTTLFNLLRFFYSKILKNKKILTGEMPFYSVILISFITTCLLMGLF